MTNPNANVSTILEAVHSNAPKSFKRELRVKLLLKRFKLDLLREGHNPENLEKVHKKKQEEFKAMSNKYLSRCKKKKFSPSDKYIQDIEWMRRQFAKLFNRMLQASKGVQRTHNRLFNGLETEQCNERYEAMLRIPMGKFKDFHKFGEKEQETKMLALIEEYGSGSKNGGFSPALLNAPGVYHNSHALDDRREGDGSKRRPQFLHELIIRLIYACLHPKQYMLLFFHRTKNIVKRHQAKLRQVRSEGRFAMMRVMMVLIPYMDFRKSMRVGFPDGEGGYRGISRKNIAKRSGISLSSVKEALINLEALGFLTKGKQHRQEYEKEDGTTGYVGLATVRCISQTLIAHLGLTDRWMQERSVKDISQLPLQERDMIDELSFAKANPDMFTAKDFALLEANVSLISD